MHDNGFTHRDLKPANILVKCKGPDWWVKIADFGISKHVIEEQTALRTSVGTPSFAAPEVLGFFRPGDRPKDFYTNAVDVWSLGVIAFRILSAENPFKDPPRLNQYVMGNIEFPSSVLLLNKVSAQGCDFVNSLMAPNSEDRPKVKDCQQHPWFREASETQEELNASNLPSSSQDYFEPEPTATWTTEDQKSSRELSKPSKVLEREEPPIARELASSSNPASSKTLAPLTPENADRMVDPDQRVRRERVASTSAAKQVFAKSWSPSRELVAPPVYESSILDDGLLKFPKGHTAQVRAVAFSPNGKLIASGSRDKTVRLWDSATIKTSGKLTGHASSVLAVEFSPSGRLLVSASSDTTVKLWTSTTMVRRHTFVGHSAPVLDATFSPDGTQLATASSDQTVKLWDLTTMKLQTTLKAGPPGEILTVAFSSTGKWLASGSANNFVRIWPSLARMEYWTFDRHMGPVTDVKFSPDDKMLASASRDSTVTLWDLTSRENFYTLIGHTDEVLSLAYSPNGTRLASGSKDGTVKLWDPIRKTMLHSLESITQINGVAFSPDGHTIATAGQDGNVSTWNLPERLLETHRPRLPKPTPEKVNQDKKKSSISSVFKNFILNYRTN